MALITSFPLVATSSLLLLFLVSLPNTASAAPNNKTPPGPVSAGVNVTTSMNFIKQSCELAANNATSTRQCPTNLACVKTFMPEFQFIANSSIKLAIKSLELSQGHVDIYAKLFGNLSSSTPPGILASAYKFCNTSLLSAVSYLNKAYLLIIKQNNQIVIPRVKQLTEIVVKASNEGNKCLGKLNGAKAGYNATESANQAVDCVHIAVTFVKLLQTT